MSGGRAGVRRCPTGEHDRDRGAVLMIVAFSLGVLVVATAFSVDLGRQVMRRRDMQAISDVISLDMARLIDGRTEHLIVSDPRWDATLTRSRNSNDFPDSAAHVLTAALGQFDKGTGSWTDTGPSDIPNAVRITASDVVEYAFVPGDGPVSRTATAFRPTDDAAVSRFGSFIASLDPESDTAVGQALNLILPGTTIGSYKGLLGAEVRLDLLGLHMPFGAVSPDQFASTNVSMHDLMLASIRAMEAEGGNTAAITALQGMLSTASTVRDVKLSDVAGIDGSGGTPAGSAMLNVAQLLTTHAFIADTDHAITIPDFNLSIPGVGSVGLELSLIESQRILQPTIDESGVNTQASFQITPQISITSTDIVSDICQMPPPQRDTLNGLLGGLLNLLTCLPPALGLPIGVLNEVFSISIDATPTIKVAGGQVTVTHHGDCTAKTLTMTPNPSSTATLTTGLDLEVNLSVAGQPVTGGPLLTASADANSSITGSAAPVVFQATDDGPVHRTFTPTERQVGSSPLGLGNVILDNLSITAAGLDLSVLENLFKPVVDTLLSTVLTELDRSVVTPLAKMLGMNIGGVDLQPQELTCGAALGPQLVK